MQLLFYLLSMLPAALLAQNDEPESGAASPGIPPFAPPGIVWEAPLDQSEAYIDTVEALILAYEEAVGQTLQPGERGKVGLKINTRGGGGLSTPHPLIEALIELLERRGFDRNHILIVDQSARSLRAARIMPPLSESKSEFFDCPVIALDEEKVYNQDWFYDSPLPPALQQEPLLAGVPKSAGLAEGDRQRKSFLPYPLMFEVDFWINLATGADDPALGVDGVLANATLWNVSNSHRFLVNQATASAAVAEIAAIPELRERWVLNFVSLECYQFIGGPAFNSIYTRAEPRLWMSSDPVALDRLLYDRINRMRLLNGFPEVEPLPRQLPFAASLGIGVFALEQIEIKTLAPTKP